MLKNSLKRGCHQGGIIVDAADPLSASKLITVKAMS